MTPPATDERWPEHLKLHEVAVRSQAIGEFLDYSPHTLCRYEQEPNLPHYTDCRTGTAFTPRGDPVRPEGTFTVENPAWYPAGYYPDTRSIERILAEYFGVDLDTIESEKRDMLDQLRRL